MNINELLPYNGKTIQTKILTDLGFNSKNINKLIKENILSRTRRGYYKVTINYKIDTKLMKYYLVNSYFDDLKEYFDSLTIKDYDAYHYRFLCDILTGDYASCYDNLYNCALVNNDEHNKVNILAYLLLITELIDLPKDKIDNLKRKLYNEDYYLDSYLECLLKKDYTNACDSLRSVKDNCLLDKIDISILRDLNIKVLENYKKKNSKEVLMYKQLFNELYYYLSNSDFDRALYTYNKLEYLSCNYDISDYKLKVVKDLLDCFDYIIRHPNLSLEDYNTNYKYGEKNNDNFILAIKRNDYINALNFCNKILIENPSQEFEIYKMLLDRIYNYLNIRTLIIARNPNTNSISHLIKNKKYKEALSATNNDLIMDEHNKNIITSLLESILSVDEIKV